MQMQKCVSSTSVYSHGQEIKAIDTFEVEMNFSKLFINTVII